MRYRNVNIYWTHTQCIDGSIFRTVQKYLKTTETDFHTFSKPDERTLNLIIKGSITDISEEELKNRGYEEYLLRQFIKRQKTSDSYGNSKSNPDNKAIFNKCEIFYISVKI